MWDDEIDTAIDEVARQVTEGSPAGGVDFRRHVIARIEAGDTSRVRWRPLFVVAPLASAAAIVLAFVMARQATVRLPPSPPDGFGGTREPDTTETGRATVRLPPDTIEAARATVRLPPSPRGFDATGEPDTLPIDPLAVAPLVVDALTPASIQMPRLETIAPIVVAPLDFTDEQRRDR